VRGTDQTQRRLSSPN